MAHLPVFFRVETNFSLKDLRAFLALGQTLNFGQTAVQLHISQSALSTQIARLEHQLAAKLFNRTTRSVSLTEAGASFREHAALLLRQAEDAVCSVRDTMALRHGKVSVAALPSLTASIVPRLLARFHKEHPNVRLSLTDKLSSEAFALVRDGRVDFALTAADPKQDDLVYEPLTQDHFLLLCAPSHPLAQKSSPVHLLETLQYPHISMSPTASVRQYVDKALAQHQIRFSPAFEVDYIATIGALLVEGLGIAVLPETACRLISDRHLNVRKLRAPGIQRPLGLVRRKTPELTPAAQALRKMCLLHFASNASDSIWSAPCSSGGPSR